MSEYEPNDLDRRIWLEELDDFVPQRVFDVHTHIYRWAFNLDPNKQTGPYAAMGRHFPEVTLELANRVDAALLPGRQVERLGFPFPFAAPCDFDGSNDHAGSEMGKAADSASLMLVHPRMSQTDIEATLRRTGAIGLKPYLVHATSADRSDASITDFLPEHQIALADRLGLIVMMHLSKRQAVADADNIAQLRRLSGTYPRVRWILAHCARSYSAWAIERAAASLRDLPNVWYDTSSVCEADALDALYTGVGMDRVMYGSDDMIGPMRGKYIAFGYAWSFLSETNHNLSLGHCDGRMTFVRYEQLRAMKRGARRLGLDAARRHALFHDTARALVDEARCDVREAMGA